jgi:hypothetical protein
MTTHRPKPEAWQEHEHVTTPIENQARKLLDEAGSPELAKHAVDSAAELHGAAHLPGSLAKTQPLAASVHDQFARQLGFGSYLSLFEASTPLASAVGKQWFTTALRTDLWVIWNDDDLVTAGTYPTREAAERAVPSSASDRST